MKRMVEYKVKAECADENERLIKAVFAELAKVRPPGVRYANFRRADGVSFVHWVSYDEGVDNAALTSLPAFKAFVAGVRDRCEVLPVTSDLKEVGSYGFFGA